MPVFVISAAALNTDSSKGSATQPEPRLDLLLPDEPVALDVEFQEYFVAGTIKWQHRIGRVAVVNTKKEAILDVYAAYPADENIKKKMPPEMFGVTKNDLLYQNGAVPARIVEKSLAKIMKGRPVVVHGGELDQKCFFFETKAWEKVTKVVDTQDLYWGMNGKQRWGLANLAGEVLGETIQVDEHTPVEDAKTTMTLYLRKQPFDRNKAVAKYVASIPPPAETLVQSGKKWYPTTAAYAPLNLGHGYNYGESQGLRGGKGGNGGRKGDVKGGAGKGGAGKGGAGMAGLAK